MVAPIKRRERLSDGSVQSGQLAEHKPGRALFKHADYAPKWRSLYAILSGALLDI